jgi:hypothetical protein
MDSFPNLCDGSSLVNHAMESPRILDDLKRIVNFFYNTIFVTIAYRVVLHVLTKVILDFESVRILKEFSGVTVI